MASFSSSSFIVATLITAAVADKYTWDGRPTNFEDALNWEGPSPLSSPGPAKVNMGTGNGNVISSLGANSFNMGSLVFNGPTTLVLGTAFSSTTLSFDSEATKDQDDSTFTPVSDFQCNQNWIVKQGNRYVGAPTAPCGGDEIVIPADNSFFVEIPQDLGIAKVTFGDGGSAGTTLPIFVTECSDTSSTLQVVGAMSSVSFVGGCTADRLGSAVDANSCPFTSCTTTTTSSSITSSTLTSVTSTTVSTTTASTTTTTTTVVAEALFQSATGMGIIAGVAILGVCIIIVLIVVGAMMLGRGSKKDSDRGVQSFENPMYDEVTASGGQINGGVDNTQTSGYMDLPAGNDTGLYDEVDIAGNGGADGYMDVGANKNQYDDEDEDEDDDQDDI